MKLELFINFDGNCREAVEFYAKVFKSEVHNLMTYGDTPPGTGYTVPESDKNRIMYAGIPMGGMVVMFSDAPSGSGFIKGNNVTPTVSLDNKDEVARVFNELKADGNVYMELGQTFFSELFGMVEDRFGVIWQVLYYVREGAEG